MLLEWLAALPVLLLMGVSGWAYAYPRDNVNIVDSLWAITRQVRPAITR